MSADQKNSPLIHTDDTDRKSVIARELVIGKSKSLPLMNADERGLPLQQFPAALLRITIHLKGDTLRAGDHLKKEKSWR